MAPQACRTCAEHGRACDGTKPVCKLCTRHLEALCTWSCVSPTMPVFNGSREARVAVPVGLEVGQAERNACEPEHVVRYKIPATYCMTDGVGEDQVIQYLVFHATRHGLLPGPQMDRHVNPLDMIQQAMASAASIHALLAFAAAINPCGGLEASKLAVYHYNEAMREIRERVDSETFGQGVVSAIGLLHFYELHKSEEIKPSSLHLSGMNQVLHSELQSRPQAIVNLIPALQRFVYHTATNALFDGSIGGASASFETIEGWGSHIAAHSGSEPMDITCISVPLVLLACVYRLSLLNSNTEIPTWLRQLEIVKHLLGRWAAAHPIWQPLGNNGTALVARLFYGACCILYQHLASLRRIPPEYDIKQILMDLSSDLLCLSNMQFPYHVAAWPLLVCGFAATDQAQRKNIRMALFNMDTNARIASMKHGVKLLDTVWYTTMGMNVLLRPDLLSPILL